MNKHDFSTQTIDYPQELLFVALKHKRSGPYSISYRGYDRLLLCDELSGREQQFVLCSVCKGVMLEASITANNKIVCSVCVPPGSTATPVAAFRNIICAYPTRCPLYLRGCDWVGTLATIQSHVERCDYLYTVCPMLCGEIMLQKLITEHTKNSCVERHISCELCMQSVKVREVSEHLETCPNFVIRCSQCRKKLQRCYLETHLIKLCMYRPVNCAYYKYGCKDKIGFCEMSQHMNGNKDAHIKLLENAILEKENQQIEQVKLSTSLEQANFLLKQLLFTNSIHVEFPCEMYISELTFGINIAMDRGININFEGISLQLVLTKESNNRLYFALVFPSHCTGTFRTLLINQDYVQDSILFPNTKIICKPCINRAVVSSNKSETKSLYYSLISTGLEGILLHPPYLQGYYFKLKLKLCVDFTRVEKQL